MPHYEIVVAHDSDVDVNLATLATEAGLTMSAADGRAFLAGELVDRAALHGVLDRLFTLGLVLLAVERRSARHRP
ncbi:MAG TPA: hypothetical protein VFZ77_06725 [Acidimicrobiales bacterium]